MNESEKEFDEEEYGGLQNAFPNAPFSVDCVRKVSDLDLPFTSERVIFVVDGRISESNYYYDNFKEHELSQYRSYLKVATVNGEPITLRKIISAMAEDEHYNNEVVAGDDHASLVSFDRSETSNIQYVARFEN